MDSNGLDGLFVNGERIVRTGYWSYDETVRSVIHVIWQPQYWGSGDPNDLPEDREDRHDPCYRVALAPPGEPGKIASLGAQLDTLEEALADATRLVGSVDWVPSDVKR